MKPEPLTNGLLVDKKEKTLKIVSQRFWLDLKGRVEWLLKEIEKEKDKKWYKFFNSSDEFEGYLKALENVKQKIKQAFSGVIEE